MVLLGLILSLVVFQLILSYQEYSKNKSTGMTLKGALRKRKSTLITLGVFAAFPLLMLIYDEVIPLNQNHGVEFNQNRETLGLPILPPNWEEISMSHQQFIKDWWNNSTVDSIQHFKKTIVYGYFNPKYEHDVYIKKDGEEIVFAASTYNYKAKSFVYWIGDIAVSHIDEDGNVSPRNPHEVEKVNKETFENFLRYSND